MPKHPCYPNPTIAEALCEIHFSYPTDKHWRRTRYGEFLKALQPDFPTMESKLEIGVDSEGEFVDSSQLPVRQRNFYRHSNRPLLCQLREGVLTVNELPRYPGWEAMLTDVLQLWERAQPILLCNSIHRIGLRYINRIPKSSKDDVPSVWVRPNDFIPHSVVKSGEGFYSRVRVTTPTSDRVVVTVADSPASGPGDFGHLVLDIDRITEKPIPLGDLRPQLELLHEEIWGIFEAALTPRLKQHLREETES